MTVSNEVLDLECQLRFIDLAAVQAPFDEPIDLFMDGFFEGVRAMEKPRSIETLKALLELRRERAGHIK